MNVWFAPSRLTGETATPSTVTVMSAGVVLVTPSPVPITTGPLNVRNVLLRAVAAPPTKPKTAFAVPAPTTKLSLAWSFRVERPNWFNTALHANVPAAPVFRKLAICWAV